MEGAPVVAVAGEDQVVEAQVVAVMVVAIRAGAAEEEGTARAHLVALKGGEGAREATAVGERAGVGWGKLVNRMHAGQRTKGSCRNLSRQCSRPTPGWIPVET